MEDKKNEINPQVKPEIVSVQTTPDKVVPKFCTAINVGLLTSKNVVMTMAYSEGKDSVAVIERIVIDLDHAKQLRDVLTNLLKEAENV
jgi:hypothetical protein